jgi:hypothetical protein
MSRRKVTILAGVAVAAAALTLGVVLTRSGDAATANAAELTQMTSYVAATSSAGNGDETNLREQVRDLMNDQGFRDDVRALRDKQQHAMDAWWDKYGDDPENDAAVAARETLREQQRTEMNALLSENGIDTTAMEQARETAQQAREKMKSLMSDDEARAELNALRDKQQKAMDAWQDKYSEDPDSTQAQTALEKLRTSAHSEMQELLKGYGIDLPEGGGHLFGGRGGPMGSGLMNGNGLMGGGGHMGGGPGGGAGHGDHDGTASDTI